MAMIFGITMGDASGVGPEILLKAWAAGELRYPVVAFGDLAVLERCNRELGYGVELRAASAPRDWREGALNVVD
ncbi:MAG: 4-phospho-D-threonate 3-dehydrogenase, partial [Bryobacteraceae bacterium]